MFEVKAAKIKRSPASMNLGEYETLLKTYNTQYKPNYHDYSILNTFKNNPKYNNNPFYSSQTLNNQNKNFDSSIDVSYQPNLEIFSNLSPFQSSKNSLTALSANLNHETNKNNNYVAKNYHIKSNSAAYKNTKSNIEDNLDESSEWEFNHSAQKPSSNEWEFKGAKKAKLFKKDKSRQTKELQAIKVPCFSPGCKTWIKITFPEEGSIEGDIITTNNQRKKITNLRGSVLSKQKSLFKKKKTNGYKKSKPQTSKLINTIQKINKPISTTEKPLKITTRKSIASFMFSTSWILSLKRVTVPMPSPSLSSATVSPFINTSNSTLKQKITNQTTTKTNTAWIKPFTLKPLIKTLEIIPATTLAPFLVLKKIDNNTIDKSNNKNIISIPLIEKNRKLKPWTHSSSSSLSSSNTQLKKTKKKIKHRPTPTTRKTIEEAAIWASSELIEAIRKALEKFRKVLIQNGIGSSPFYSETTVNELPTNGFSTKIQNTWNDFKNGNWIEQTIAKIVMDDENLITNKNVSADKIVSSIIPPLLLKLEDDYENAKFNKNNDKINNQQQNYYFKKYYQRNRRSINEAKDFKIINQINDNNNNN